MANILTSDDATFAATVGNWVPNPFVPNTVTRQTSPTSPAGNNVCELLRTGDPPGNGFVRGEIQRDVYSVSLGDKISMEVAYSAPGSNAGTGTLFCQIAITLYPANPAAGGVGVGVTSSAPFTKGDGWHRLATVEVTVPSGYASVGCSVTFAGWTGQGVVVGDVAYFSDVFLGIPVAAGGWGVGMVRMGAN